MLKFYPTSVLVTGYDIIFFWVIRMVFSALYVLDEVPFSHVFIHGLVRDSDGRKMSKSLGNGIDPLEIIDTYGADALRFTLATGNSPGNDMRFYIERVEASRNFANKIWNASRFIFMNLEKVENKIFIRADVEAGFELSDKWIISRVNNLSKDMTENMDKFELGIAVSKVYDFAWSEFCDWYIELVKQRLYGEDSISKDAALFTLTYVLEKILKLLHPFMPFITEEIWSYMNKEEKIIVSSWPIYHESDEFKSEEAKMDIIINAIRNLRNLRAEMNVPPSRKAKLLVVSNTNIKNVIKEGESYFTALASSSEVDYRENEEDIPHDAVSVLLDGAKLFIPMDELVDFEKEVERLSKEKEKLDSEIKRVVGKLNNQGFLAKAPEALVNEEKAKQDKFQQMLDAVNERLNNVKAKL